MVSILIATAALASGFGWYQVASWHQLIHQVQTEYQKTQSPLPGCGRNG